MTQETTAARPLVTFALFAYNQEQYIREAVEGAFSQTYEPLEIILSDDCSSDRTFEIMQEMATAYTGPHEVRVRRSEVNRGLIGHVNDVTSQANGKIIIFAAGDDISFAKRSESVVSNLLASNADLAWSRVAMISEEGMALPDRNTLDVTFTWTSNITEIATSMALYIGASGAITRRLVDEFGPIVHANAHEDQVFGYRSSISRGTTFVNEPLVYYRVDVGISQLKTLSRLSKKDRRIHILNNRLAVLLQRLEDTRKQIPDRNDLICIIKKQITFMQLQIEINSNVYGAFCMFARLPASCTASILQGVWLRLKYAVRHRFRTGEASQDS